MLMKTGINSGVIKLILGFLFVILVVSCTSSNTTSRCEVVTTSGKQNTTLESTTESIKTSNYSSKLESVSSNEEITTSYDSTTENSTSSSESNNSGESHSAELPWL